MSIGERVLGLFGSFFGGKGIKLFICYIFIVFIARRMDFGYQIGSTMNVLLNVILNL